MPVAELFVHASLLTIGVFVVAAITDVVVKRIRSQPLARSGPRNRKVNQSMSKNTSPLRSREDIEARLAQVSSELAIFKQVNAPQASIDFMQGRVDELSWVLQEAR